MDRLKNMKKKTKIIVAAILALVLVVSGAGGVYGHALWQNHIVDEQLATLNTEYTTFKTSFMQDYAAVLPEGWTWPSDSVYQQAVTDRDDVAAFYALQSFMALVLDLGQQQVQEKIAALTTDFEAIKQSDGYNDAEKSDVGKKKQAVLDILNKEQLAPADVQVVKELLAAYKTAVDTANKRVADDKKKAEDAAAAETNTPTYNDYTDDDYNYGGGYTPSPGGSSGGGGGGTNTGGGNNSGGTPEECITEANGSQWCTGGDW